MDLGGRGWQTQLYVTLPSVATALISGALLAFALSFDEVIVTVFTSGAQNTLPIWIFGELRLGQQLPEVNAVVSDRDRADDHPRAASRQDRRRRRRLPHNPPNPSHRPRPHLGAFGLRLLSW